MRALALFLTVSAITIGGLLVVFTVFGWVAKGMWFFQNFYLLDWQYYLRCIVVLGIIGGVAVTISRKL